MLQSKLNGNMFQNSSEGKMIGDMALNETDKELDAWIDGITFSRQVKNLSRDFSDAVLMAEILKFYYPRYVELHNYVPANNYNTKKENWNTLNRKVLTKIDMKLNKDTIHHLANASQGAIEKLLLELKIKILRDSEEFRLHKSKLKFNMEGINVQISKKKIVDNSMDDNSKQLDLDPEISQKSDNKEICEFNSSKLRRFRGLFIIFSWITCFFRIWNIISYCRFPRFGKRNILVDIATERIESANDENISCAIYTELKQQLREKEEIISTLNHKITYLKNSMKLKDLRISSLTTQILQNTIGIDCSSKSPSKGSAHAKLRSRSHNFHENKTN
ncbi:sperm flagellar protein 1 [Linepithema humile]|uniref:sperm flagellar protein 1 n=1 Tax=Linepithema humile TaxID=83485 RepID=UPI00351DBBE6